MSVTVLHPRPTATRFRLHRAGLIGLYEYENETFEFERGHLLLRGANGAGKSKALELLLPLLLDGELRAERLDPFGGRGRSMRWNLTGDQESRAPATGFSWLELHRRDAQGVERWVTLVLMVQARKGETGVHSCFALLQAEQEPGGELRGRRIAVNAWLSPARHPITKAAFAELAGELIGSASVFRERVNALLFGVAQDRYEAVVRLLLSLRKPQLSQTLDPQELSARLTEALPELDRDAVLRVATRLEQLDRLRAEAAELREVRTAVAMFTRTYRDFARAALKDRGGALRDAVQAREQCGEVLARAQAAVDAARQSRAAVAERRQRLEHELASTRGAERELRASEDWRQAERLEELRRLATEAEQAYGAATAELERAEHDAAELLRAAELADRALATQHAAVAELLARAGERATRAGVARHDAAVEGLVEEDRDPAAVRALLEQLAADRAEALAALAALLGALARAEEAFRAARERFEDAEAGQRERQAERAEAAQRLEAVRHGLLEQLERWLESLKELPADDAFAGALADSLAAAGEPGARAARELVRERAAHTEQRLHERHAELAAARATLAGEREPLAAEHARLSAHEDPPPAPLPFRTADRSGRAGAPLWALVEFADRLDDRERAGLEGALEGAGLLDAWVMPDGSVLDADDAVLVPRGTAADFGPTLTDVLVPRGTAADAGPTLTDVLVPLEDASVSPAVIEAVLARVALGEESERTAWVDPEGGFALGPLQGRHRVEAARYIGAAARAAHRARRLAELAAQLAALAGRDRALADEAGVVEHRMVRLREEAGSLPGDEPALRAFVELERARAEEQRAAERTTAEQAAMAARSDELRVARDRAFAHAREHGLPSPGDEAGLTGVRDALASYRAVCGDLIGAERLRRERRQAAGLARAHAERAAHVYAAAGERAREAGRRRSARAGAHEEAAAAVGATVEQLRARLAELEATAVEAERGLRAAHEEDIRVAETAATAQSEATHAEAELAAADTGVQAAHARVARLGALGAWSLALGEQAPEDHRAASEWSVERTLAALRGASREALATRRAFQTLLADVDREADELRHRLSASADFQVTRERVPEDAELTLVQVRHGGQSHPLGELEAWLEAELHARERTIAEEDRRLFASFLVGGLADALRERIDGAAQLVASMNEALTGCTTSSGMSIELEWNPRQQDEAGLREAVSLLRRDVALLADDARTRLVEFLRGRIEDARHSLEQGSSTEHVMAALDYRDWHEFRVIQIRDGKREVLTRRRHQQGSGGEKAVALHLPLFAAAAAQFAAAREESPRMILLDEAFAGIDERMRAQLLGLLERFDLDFVLTSHELWGCYPELSALGIYHLHREPGIPGVATAHFRWDGERRVEVEPAA